MLGKKIVLKYYRVTQSVAIKVDYFKLITLTRFDRKMTYSIGNDVVALIFVVAEIVQIDFFTQVLIIEALRRRSKQVIKAKVV
jgi:hypothetical protein